MRRACLQALACMNVGVGGRGWGQSRRRTKAEKTTVPCSDSADVSALCAHALSQGRQKTESPRTVERGGGGNEK